MLRLQWLLLASILYYRPPLSAQPLPAIETEMPLRWKTRIGNTTFRTNMLLHGGELYIGSNGASYNDSSVISAEEKSPSCFPFSCFAKKLCDFCC